MAIANLDPAAERAGALRLDAQPNAAALGCLPRGSLTAAGHEVQVIEEFVRRYGAENIDFYDLTAVSSANGSSNFATSSMHATSA
jgi:hypothetical protein